MKKGFTLVELIIVIAVIGVLAAILIPTFSNVIEKANQNSALSDAKNALTTFSSEEINSDENLTAFGIGTVVLVKKADKDWYFTYTPDGIQPGDGTENADVHAETLPVDSYETFCNQECVYTEVAATAYVDKLPVNVVMYITDFYYVFSETEMAEMNAETAFMAVRDIITDGSHIIVKHNDQYFVFQYEYRDGVTAFGGRGTVSDPLDISFADTADLYVGEGTDTGDETPTIVEGIPADVYVWIEW